MEKVFTQVSHLDRRCYQSFGLSEDLLMEHAAMAIVSHIKQVFPSGSNILILCGPGNNGADGIALARLLAQYYQVELSLPFGAQSPMAKQQLLLINNLSLALERQLEHHDVIVDCLFGSGLSRPLNKKATTLIEQLNQRPGYKISCDIPSGLDASGQPSPIAFHSDITITMGGLKTSLFSDCAKDYVGTIVTADLGLPRDIYQDETNCHLLEVTDLKLPLRQQHNSHKGSFGHLAVIAGDKSGAAILASLAAFNFGCGLVSLISQQHGAPAQLPPHIMHHQQLPSNLSAVAIGMGLNRDYWHSNPDQLNELMNSNIAKVIDADLFYWPELSKLFNQPLVLTPHPKEFCALLKLTNIADISVDKLQQDRFNYVRRFSSQYPKVVLLLKGCNTLIAQGDNIYINSLGSAILSKGGSGDVLAGLIAALLTQGYQPLDAAISGSLAHAIAGQQCQSQVGINDYALIPQDLIEQIKHLPTKASP
jgi:hydroxyethylthiazole kinase-like uncharacterized protein yjeF